VTGGGVKLSEVHLHNCESKKFPGLFLCGEIMDVFGRIGGFNFYWAWYARGGERRSGRRGREVLILFKGEWQISRKRGSKKFTKK
jgi:hypothetical protein